MPKQSHAGSKMPSHRQRRVKAVTVLAVISLAIGIAGNAFVYSLVDSLVNLRLPYTDPDRIVLLGQRENTMPDAALTNLLSALPVWADYRERSQTLVDWATMTLEFMSVSDGERAVWIMVGAATPSFFHVLGERTARGRVFTELEGAEGGAKVAHDVYPYTAFSTYSSLLFPAWALADGLEAFAMRVADPPTRERLVSEMRTIFLQQTGAGPESVQFREVEGRPELQGRLLSDMLAESGRPTTLDEGVEALIDLELAGGFIGIFEGMSEEDVVRIMRHESGMFETDGDLVRPGVGFPHPRSYGSFPRILGKYVREDGVLTLEEAIRKMTNLPSTWLGQSDRGTIGVGMAADLVVFDPETIRDRAEFTDPHHYSIGIRHVFVAGEQVLDEGQMTAARPGRFLERADRQR